MCHRSIGGICDAGTTVKKRDSARGNYRDISQFGSARFKESKHMLTCLNDPPKYGSTPWQIDIYPPVLGGGVRTWPGLQSTLMWEKTFCS
jgi:hypothetical protein